ncbi:MAG: biotin--[acetyl-CoA-carboxylase] ligase [Gemmataceae bacterium]|nr:biotin--[acetyl-CoA-carboxylase] ligase [Gemmataceae bacterium]
MTPYDEWHLETHRLGRRVLVFDQLDSTSTTAAALANDPANDGVVVLANSQTAGRGQHGRSWQCAPGTGVLMSVLLFPPPEIRRPALLTAWAAVSVCEMVREVANLQGRIKWPNDVLLRGRKVCGILIESRAVADSRLAVVAGIGLNVNQTAAMFDDAGLPDATSLGIAAERLFDAAEVARTLIRHLDDEYTRMCHGDRATLEACWKWRLGLLGRQVEAECGDGKYHGRLREVSFDGLELEQGDATVLRLEPERVRQLRLV